MNAIAPAFGCATGAMPFENALERVLRLVSAPLAFGSIPLTFCVGRVLAEPFEVRLNLPGFDQSAMDGYAVCGADIIGAPLPHGADAVIAQENVHRDGDLVHIERVPPAGTNVRRRGEDIGAGNELIDVRLLQRDACRWAERTGSDGSRRLAPLLTSDAFVFMPAGMGDVGQGDRLQVFPFMPCAIKPGLEADCG